MEVDVVEAIGAYIVAPICMVLLAWIIFRD